MRAATSLPLWSTVADHNGDNTEPTRTFTITGMPGTTIAPWSGHQPPVTQNPNPSATCLLMPLPSSPAAAIQAVLWGGLLLGVLLGALAQATRFCTMGALADWFSYGGTARLMMWVLAVAVAAVGAAALMQLGWLDATRTAAWSAQLLWLSCLVGGTLFGVGMVLASGCPQRNLVRAGAGNLKAWVTLGSVGLASQMTLRGVLAGPRSQWLDSAGLALGHPQDLGSVLASGLGGQLSPANLSAATWRWAVLALLLLGAALLLWRCRAALDRSHWLGGAGVGLLVTAAWALTGHIGYLAEHPETLEAVWLGTASHRPEGLSFVAPLAQALDLLTLWSDRNTVPTFGVVVTLGVLLGSALAAWLRGEFRVESFSSAADLGQHLLGGLLMGFGGVTALGCSIGQGITGLSLLSSGAALAVLGMVLGTWLGVRWQTWRLERVG